ncbi:MAG: hypothetical protein IJE05_05340 [Clostridia bacterium]|nr:hypothetical protein [Clostridia bacterium]
MNQILSTSMPIEKKKNNRRKKQPIEIRSILKFFGLVILVFGVFMIGTGVYSVYKNHSEQQQNLQPTIAIENKSDTVILLKVTHKKNIAKIEYGWNEEDKVVVNGNNGQYLEQEIDVPSGTNTLYVKVQDEEGKEMTYEKQYEIESNINFEVAGNKIKITYNGEKMISYMTYKWDDEEEQKIEINDTNIEQEIDAIKGLHTLTVVAVDEDNNKDTKSQKINGVSKPELIIDIDDEVKHFVIKTSDEELLTRIEIRLNQDDNQKYVLNIKDKNLKELEYVLPMELQTGENLIEVKVYNSNNITAESGARYIKQ